MRLLTNKPITKGRPLLVNAGIKAAYKKEVRKIIRRSILLSRELFKRLLPRIKKEFRTVSDSMDYEQEFINQLIQGSLQTTNQNNYNSSFILSEFEDGLSEIEATFEAFVDDQGKLLIENMFGLVEQNADKIFANQMKMLWNEVSPHYLLPVNNDILARTWVYDNVSLIKKITSDYFDKITRNVIQIFSTGITREDLASEIYKIGQTTFRRADLIAEDQISKAYMSMNLQKFKQAGITKFEWVHTHGGLTPREHHLKTLNGQIFDIDNPPVIDLRTGERGYPGQAPFCRCVMCPVISPD